MVLSQTTITDLVQLCANVGFPIVMCIIIFYQFKDMNDKREKETKEIVTAINEQKNELIRLSEKIDDLRFEGKMNPLEQVEVLVD